MSGHWWTVYGDGNLGQPLTSLASLRGRQQCSPDFWELWVCRGPWFGGCPHSSSQVRLRNVLCSPHNAVSLEGAVGQGRGTYSTYSLLSEM